MKVSNPRGAAGFFNVSPLRATFDTIAPVPAVRSMVVPRSADTVTVADVRRVIGDLRTPNVKATPGQRGSIIDTLA